MPCGKVRVVPPNKGHPQQRLAIGAHDQEVSARIGGVRRQGVTDIAGACRSVQAGIDPSQEEVVE
jgi:hypothetical protein